MELSAHKGAVVAVSLDAANRVLLSAGLDGVLRTWDFRKQRPLGEKGSAAPLCMWTCNGHCISSTPAPSASSSWHVVLQARWRWAAQ